MSWNRREFLVASAPAVLSGADLERVCLGLVHSSHKRLARPSGGGDALDYERVRDMVWRAIGYGAPRAGSLDGKIRPGAWVVVKPNIVYLRPHHLYATGDITDLRVTRAVAEYLARYTRAGRITVAEGGTYRNFQDQAEDHVVMQGGNRVNALTFDWGEREFPGMSGSLGGVLAGLRRDFPEKKFDYVDLSYDAVRNPDGSFRRIKVRRTPSGVGAFGARADYFVTNTTLNCDFLISVPVMKVHANCGITACMKNYVGTAPREAYGLPGNFNNMRLHREHTVEGRIDGFIVDLVSFHPPDYCVVDALRGLQASEHSNGAQGQLVQSNLVMAGEDPVALDALAARLMGFQPRDIDYLNLAAQRGIGRFDFRHIDVRGDEPDRFGARWQKPKHWFGRCNRDWLLTAEPGQDLRAWTRHITAGDTLNLTAWAGRKPQPGSGYGAAVHIHAGRHVRGFLWAGAHGRFTATLNGEMVMREAADTRYRIGQFQCGITLRPGENLLVFRVEELDGPALLSALVTGPNNDGDTAEGVRYAS